MTPRDFDDILRDVVHRLRDDNTPYELDVARLIVARHMFPPIGLPVAWCLLCDDLAYLDMNTMVWHCPTHGFLTTREQLFEL